MSNIGVLGSGDGVELWRKGLEVGILCELVPGVGEPSLLLGLEVQFCWANRGCLAEKAVLVSGF